MVFVFYCNILEINPVSNNNANFRPSAHWLLFLPSTTINPLLFMWWMRLMLLWVCSFSACCIWLVKIKLPISSCFFVISLHVTDFKNVSIVGHYVKDRTKDAQFIIIRYCIRMSDSKKQALSSYCYLIFRSDDMQP